MRVLYAILLLSVFLTAAVLEEKQWESGETLITFLEKNSLPAKIYYDLDREEKELADEIRAGVDYYVLREKGKITQVLIPISEELQLHIAQRDGKYVLELLPIVYQKQRHRFVISIEHSPYQDIVENTKNIKLANEFISAFKNSIDFKRSLRKGDKVVVVYNQKQRLGKPFGTPVIEAAMVETRGKKHFIYLFDGRYYDEKGREVEGFLLKRPVRHARITSKFTLRRFHPVLKKYRAHLGVDFGARRGTPVRAAGSGRVIFAGRKGGYGNTVIIRHQDGYKTLYAHLSKFRGGIKRGKWVKQGQVIGYVGSTGLSTGPHLHFGLYKYNRPINPLRVVKVTKSYLAGKKRKEFMKRKASYKKEIEEAIIRVARPIKQEKIDRFVYLNGSADISDKPMEGTNG
ncbi:peptidoglycan DD-metalloendopeptidase family protein [Nitrosophilus alvini]|uniref:peptidoglycan DD-metalloendopeptidase family protein n=1 Tax=Nitrosophilus alvini TaxID=2714855 RepID=UPI00190CC896|nr:peptidoglycan DD-metalloendopeptidase family protein [Nitrosophilus alvini]